MHVNHIHKYTKVVPVRDFVSATSYIVIAIDLCCVNCIQDSCEIFLGAVVISNSFYHHSLILMSHAVIVDFILELLCRLMGNFELVSMLLLLLH